MQGAAAPSKVANVLTVDVEDWYQLAHRRLAGADVPVSHHVERDTLVLLDDLADHDVRATFFVVGSVALAYPMLMRAIHDAGHEIGSHGHEHRRVDAMSPAQFGEDLRRSIAAIEQASQAPVRGFRAPEFSIGRNQAWVFDAIAGAGLTYDSSVVPVRSRRYGVAEAPTVAHRLATSAGQLVELPVGTARLLTRRVPLGGGYLRVLPLAVAQRAISEANDLGDPAVVFLHPYDVARERLAIDLRPGVRGGGVARTLWRARRNVGRRRLATRGLQALLRRGPFVPAGELADAMRSAG